MKKSILGMTLLLTTQAYTADKQPPPSPLVAADAQGFRTENRGLHGMGRGAPSQPIPIPQQPPYRTQPLPPGQYGGPGSYPGTSFLMSPPPDDRLGKHSSVPTNVAGAGYDGSPYPTAPQPTTLENRSTPASGSYGGPADLEEWQAFQAFKKQQAAQTEALEAFRRQQEKDARHAKEVEALEAYRRQQELNAASGRVSPTDSMYTVHSCASAKSAPPGYSAAASEELVIAEEHHSLPYVTPGLALLNTLSKTVLDLQKAFTEGVAAVAAVRTRQQTEMFAPSEASPKGGRKLSLRRSSAESRAAAQLKDAHKKQQEELQTVADDHLLKLLATAKLCNEKITGCMAKTKEELLQEAGPIDKVKELSDYTSI